MDEGNPGDVLTTDGDGNVSWQSPAIPRPFSETDTTLIYVEVAQLKNLKQLQAKLIELKKKIDALEAVIEEEYYRKEEND